MSREQGVPATVVSNDKDLLQLVRDDAPAVTVWDRPARKTLDEAAVVQKMGVRNALYPL